MDVHIRYILAAWCICLIPVFRQLCSFDGNVDVGKGVQPWNLSEQ